VAIAYVIGKPAVAGVIIGCRHARHWDREVGREVGR
jgi:aryl-alcohol dehydrogenase-like predicted oxidoreductase